MFILPYTQTHPQVILRGSNSTYLQVTDGMYAENVYAGSKDAYGLPSVKGCLCFASKVAILKMR
jgi:hypothetical protein